MNKTAPHHQKIILGIESSCDETAVAVVREDKVILSNIVSSQIKNHARYGGVVPEIAARAHLEQIEDITKLALNEADVTLDHLDGVAATCGPGLIGGVIVGMMAGKTIATMKNKPFIGVNHLEGHILSPRLSDNIAFPYLVLLVSGAHTQILIAHGLGHYELLGTTLDDAAGECFDKVGRMLGLPFPGGRYVAELALECKNRIKVKKEYPLPRPLKGQKNCNFSFSGLKTAVLRYCHDKISDNEKIALSASMEDAVADVMEDRMKNAIAVFKNRYDIENAHIVSGGGVAANITIKNRLTVLAEKNNMIFTAPPAYLCTDNGAMIAWAGMERLLQGQSDPMSIKARPRWPLEELSNAETV